MDNPDILREIALLLDFASLVKLGRDTDSTLGVSKLFRDPMFWRQKTVSLAKRPLIDHPEVSWIRTYLIVEKFSKDIEQEKARIATEIAIRPMAAWEVEALALTIASPIYSQGFVDVTTLSILFHIHRPHKIGGRSAGLTQLRIKNLDVFLWLLDGSYLDRKNDMFDVLLSTPHTDAVEIARHITSLVEVPYHTVRDIILRCVGLRSLNLLLFLIERFPGAVRSGELLTTIMRYNNLPMLKLVLSKYADELTKAELEAALSYLSNFASIPRAAEMTQLVLDRLSVQESGQEESSQAYIV